jgi:hypothetical protein
MERKRKEEESKNGKNHLSIWRESERERERERDGKRKYTER